MTDDELSELILRASAYLDGDLDAAETVRAEADPDVMAEVAAMRELRADLADVEPAAPAVRDAAIAAALAEFDLRDSAASAASAPAAPPGRVVPFRPRPTYARWLTAAAAVVVVGMLGLVAVRAIGNGGQPEAGAPNVAAPPEADDGDGTARLEAGDAAEAVAESAEESAAPAAAPAADVGPNASATTAAATELSTMLAAEESASQESASAEDVTGGTTGFPPFDPERPIASVDELAAVGGELQARVDAGTIGVTPETRCDDPFPLVQLQRGLYDDGSGARDVVIAVDPATLQTQAIDTDTCAVLADTAAP